ncbi:MAG: alanine dehydrogenase, partial [Candidatus Aminicenantes bacterium]|nr:alanine dehydrogenase [Candidatus Aminicenantes bacterium]
HYCVPNITSAVSRTSTKVLSNLAAPFIDEIGDTDLEKVFEENETISSGIYVYKGRIVKKIIAERFKLPYTDISSISKK